MTEFSSDLVAELLEATDRETESKARGDLLEDLAAHMFSSIPGVKVTQRDIPNVHRSEEIDLVLFNQQLPDGLEVFEPFIFVECKNTKTPVGSPALTVFGKKLRSRNASLGILVARFGVTGDPSELTSAQQAISDELAEGREIIVVTEKDLSKLRSAADIVELLIRRRSSLLATCGFVQNDDRNEDEHSGSPASAPGRRLRGWRGIEVAIRQEREQLVTEMLSRDLDLPEDSQTLDELILDRSNILYKLLHSSPPGQEEFQHWRAVLEAMVDLGAVACALLERQGAWEREPSDIVASMRSHTPNLRHVSLTSKLYADILSYYTLEALNQEDLDGRSAALALIGLMVDSHRLLDDSLHEFLASQGS